MKNSKSVEPNIADLVNGWLKKYKLDYTAKKLGITNYKEAFICLVDGNNEAEKAVMFREAIR